MRTIEQEWFDQLHESQLEDLKVFMKPKYFNVFNGVIDKYSDTAHFIYELIQNADDAGATEVEIDLQRDKFIFTHNGTSRFTVSDPKKEELDKRVGKLGHINSICSIGFSSKNYEAEIKKIKIGKFGVGFKAVFQYTSTPEIYDSPFCFRIDNYIVPTRIESERYQIPGKTVFVLPFNHNEITPIIAFDEIYQKLQHLDYPQLFLHNVKTIKWKTAKQSETIEKVLENEGKYRDIIYSLYYLKKKDDKQRVLLLSRTVEIQGHGRHKVAIGYYIDHGRILTKSIRNIHCFFPTNENIGTCYVIHAPFALVDNRQQIKRDNEINRTLFKSVAQLAADSLLVLRDWRVFDKAKLLGDNILHLIKYDTSSFDRNRSVYDYSKVSCFFKECYKQIFEEEPLFLSRNGKYLYNYEAWWAGEDVLRLFDDDQINDLTVLSSVCKLDRANEDEDYYDDPTYGCVLTSISQREIDESEIDIDKLDGERLAEYITSAFMKKQSTEWLDRFYDYVLRRRLIEEYEVNKGYRSKAPMRRAAIIKNHDGEFVRAYGDNNKLRIYFYEEGVTATEVSINTDLYDQSGKFREVIKQLKVKVPSPLDHIRIQINRQEEKLQTGTSISIDEINDIFIKVILFYNRCPLNEREELIELMKTAPLFLCDNNTKDGIVWTSTPQEVFKDLPILREYFTAGSKRTSSLRDENRPHYFLNIKSYERCIEEVGETKFKKFIEEIIIKDTPAIISYSMSLNEEERKLRAHEKIYTKKFPSFDGLMNVIKFIEDGNGTKELSVYVWSLLINNTDESFFKNDVSEYFYYTDRIQHWPHNSLIRELRTRRWLYVKGKIRSIIKDAYKEDLLEEGYAYNADLIARLGISSTPNVKETEMIKEMSADTRETFALGKELRRLGFTDIEQIKQMKTRLSQLEKKEEEEAEAQKMREERARLRKQQEEQQADIPKRKNSAGLKGSDFESPDNTKAKYKPSTNPQGTGQNIEDILHGFEEKAKVQKEEFEKVVSLRDRISQAEKYSFDWLTALMELEVQSQGSTGATGKKSLYISFDTIYPSRKDRQMLILSDPSRYIPSSLEDMDSIPVTFVLRNGTAEKFIFDSASVKNDTLIMKSGPRGEAFIEKLDKHNNDIQYSFIEVNQPIEVLKYWESRINGMELEPEYSLKANLRPDIEFIFGPPGTGKTTTLAQRINDLIDGAIKEIRILVLAPTNKACDVLTRKLHEKSDGDDSWIWRFVKTDDPYIEEEELVYDRKSNISRQKKVCVISTIARYAFDGFDDGDLRSIDWDYVIIDEASMIPLYEILLPLYNPHSRQIIISGDPFQIEPIVNIDLWKGENIYTMVKLNDFVNPHTEPYQFKVSPLMTQYRSIPAIGELFSGYLYGSSLKHHRTEKEHRLLNMGLKENPLNIISFPVGKDSIFDLKRLAKSNIQVYSVLFTVELVKYLARNLAKNHSGEEIRVGVISPYSAEIQAIQKIYNQSSLPYDNIEVIFGSAHGFQGDQCDIIIAVINPPASGMKRAADMTFVNNRNILNVAISRASDYLYLLIPEKDYECFDSLYEIKKIGRKMNALKCSFTPSDTIEKIMFGKSQHIETNTYVTSHKMTNVFNETLTKYEVRIDENAIDIQINDFA